jgi:hypothetical protein
MPRPRDADENLSLDPRMDQIAWRFPDIIGKRRASANRRFTKPP